MRLIDADALLRDIEIEEFYGIDSPLEMLEYIAGMIDNAPTIEAEPVRHGRWIAESDGGTRCSVCKQTVKEDSSGVAVPVDLSDMPYCPKCGAKMDEVSG